MNKAEKFFLVALILAAEICTAPATGIGPPSISKAAWLLVAMIAALLFINWPK